MQISLKGFMGYVRKSSKVESDDPDNSMLVVTMEGRAKPFILVQPSVSISFRRGADQSNERVIDLITNSKPFHITAVSNGVEGKASTRVETVEEGSHYRVVVTNRLDQGRYAGVVVVRTDMDEKPVVNIYVRGAFE